jgi:hypothetical protein
MRLLSITSYDRLTVKTTYGIPYSPGGCPAPWVRRSTSGTRTVFGCGVPG